MQPDEILIVTHLLGALLAGAIIGLERSYHGRPAGFRTHTLVCLASSLLMLVTLFQTTWLHNVPFEAVRTDPTRMAQGIMTGIGFLGAGVIFKEGLSVRGLTTAASIWMTAAIGILMGIGFYLPAVLATVLTLGVLSIFRKIESHMPSLSYAFHSLRFDRNDVLDEEEVRNIMQEHGFNIANMSYRMSEDGTTFEYRMMLRSRSAQDISVLASHLLRIKKVKSFQLSPTGD
ncbi:putative Mg2+ transporter-C (MgtC) family protein [Paucimonas lemoignei]|uniref:Protein MgtC n=1 Tax=Paucimonas lemoignei TaxID=29443 RepID=A0A4R3I1L6_PAULE|nr:MgtC/SapB family protein [Paucimonas lemoignei]TCS39432.1 putative Mg2+ transporter-C (MgtC) family protein [Paucimonas lemoignei]